MGEQEGKPGHELRKTEPGHEVLLQEPSIIASLWEEVSIQIWAHGQKLEGGESEFRKIIFFC